MAIELEVKLKDGVSSSAVAAAHQIEVLNKQFQTLQTSMVKAQALGDTKAFEKAESQFKRVSQAIQSMGAELPKSATEMKALANAQKQATAEAKALEAAQKKALAASQSAAAKEAKSIEAAQKKALAANKAAEKERKRIDSEQRKALKQQEAGAEAAASAQMEIAKGVAKAYAAIGAAVVATMTAAYHAASSHGLLVAQLNAMSGSAKGGEAVIEMMRKLERVLPLAQKEMEPLAQTMMRAGVRDIPRLTQGLKAAAASTAMLGDEGGKAMATFVGDLNKSAESITGMGDLTSRLDGLGLTVQELGKAAGLGNRPVRELRMRLDELASTPAGLQKLGAIIQDITIKKGAPAMQAMGATLSSVFKKITGGLNRLFSGVQQTQGFKTFSIELQRFAQLLGLVDDASGGTKDAVTSAFNTIFKIASKAIEGIHIAILDLQIAYLEWRIALDPAIKKWNEFSDGVSSRLPDWISFQNVVRGIGVIMAALAVSVGLVLAPFIAATAVVVGLGVALVALAGKASSLGNDIMMGIVEGIKKGAAQLKTAWNIVVGGLPKALADKLEIKSPSRVMMRLGLALPQGLEQGIEQGSPDAIGATARMAMGVAGGGAVGVSAVAPSGRGGGVVVNLAPGSIQVTGASGESETSLVEEAIVSMFERIALTQGVA